MEVKPEKEEDLGKFYIECFVYDEKENFDKEILEINISEYYESCQELVYSDQTVAIGEVLTLNP